MSQEQNARPVPLDTAGLDALMASAKEHCSKRGQSVAIYGAGATRTRLADDLAEHYACSTIVVDWHHIKAKRIPRNALLLCDHRPVGPFEIPLEIVRYADALEAIGYSLETAP